MILKMADKENTSFGLLSLVGIVAIVGIVGLIMTFSPVTNNMSSTDDSNLAGDAKSTSGSFASSSKSAYYCRCTGCNGPDIAGGSSYPCDITAEMINCDSCSSSGSIFAQVSSSKNLGASSPDTQRDFTSSR